MEDIRFQEDKVKLQKSIKINKFLSHFKRNWWKYLVLLALLFLMFFPDICGHVLGSWWNDFATSFLSKITY